MANNNVIPSGFTKPSLVTADGEEKQFNVRRPAASLAREFYKMRRRSGALADEFKEICAQEAKIDEELVLQAAAQIAGGDVAGAKPYSADRVAELRRLREGIEKLKEQSDVDFHQNLYDTCALITDTQDLEIDWDASDLRQIRGAVDFFAVSANSSGYNAKT